MRTDQLVGTGSEVVCSVERPADAARTDTLIVREEKKHLDTNIENKKKTQTTRRVENSLIIFFGDETFAHGATCYVMRFEKR